MAKETNRTETVPAASDQACGSVMEALSLRLRAPLKRYFQNHHIPPDEVEDLLQEVFLKLSARAGLETVERLDAYVFAAASNLLRDRRRHQKSHVAAAHEPYDEIIHGSAQPALEPDRILLGTQRIAELVAALYELPERVREVFSLYHFEDMSHAQISERLGIAISTIEKNMARANAHLLNRLGR